MRDLNYNIRNSINLFRQRLCLSFLRRRMMAQPPLTSMRESFLGYRIHINDAPSFYILYKEIFIKKFYHFYSDNPAPLILDLGSNIGMSILYFKHIYPNARIIGFEPDPEIFPFLEKNIACNKLKNVELIHAAVAANDGPLSFYSDAKQASFLSYQQRLYVPGSDRPSVLPSKSIYIPDGWKEYKVTCVRLKKYLSEPVDFLKMNIEGSEYDVLLDSADKLSVVKEMLIEYHHLPGLRRTLHQILSLLNELGFEYLINDFDFEINRATRPPFQLQAQTKYYLLVYARRIRD